MSSSLGQTIKGSFRFCSQRAVKQNCLILEVKAVNAKMYLKIVSERLKNYMRGWRR